MMMRRPSEKQIETIPKEELFLQTLAKGVVKEEEVSITEYSTIFSSNDSVTELASTAFKKSVILQKILQHTTRGVATSTTTTTSTSTQSATKLKRTRRQQEQGQGLLSSSTSATKANIKQVRQRLRSDPLFLGQVSLGLGSMLLVSGETIGAAGCFVLAFYLVQELTKGGETSSTSSSSSSSSSSTIAKTLEVWLGISFVSVFASLGSWLYLQLFGSENTLVYFHKVWLWGIALPKSWGLLVGYLLYVELFHDAANTTNNNSNNNNKYCKSDDIPKDTTVIECLEIQMRVLRGRGRVTSAGTIIEAKHGPTSMSTSTTSSSLNHTTKMKNWNKQTFQLPVFSHWMDAHQYIDCHIWSSSDETWMGSARVTIPRVSNLKVVSWYPVEMIEGEESTSVGGLLVEIQVQPRPQVWRLSIVLSGSVACLLALFIAR
jgi:hypothetical protein